jgi:hypothetical protein
MLTILRRMSVLGLTVQLFAAAPTGWFLAGNNAKGYSTGIDSAVTFAGQPAAYLQSVSAQQASQFGTLMQTFRADLYRGKRVRFSGYVKSNQLDNWAGLWMRIDEGSVTAAFDNMYQRSIQGTTDWTPYSVVLDIPRNSTGINIGILMNGNGEVWLSGITFEVVDTQTQVTATTSSAEPSNLSLAAQ